MSAILNCTDMMASVEQFIFEKVAIPTPTKIGPYGIYIDS